MPGRRLGVVRNSGLQPGEGDEWSGRPGEDASCMCGCKSHNVSRRDTPPSVCYPRAEARSF